ncbi:hypothetical protein E3E29_01445 [Thermococcus sp. Bubb.Bath]|nr:hypothetical protein [Thermococcus sp. Bubb.Bath]
MQAITKRNDPIREVLPWASSDYLERLMEERKKEMGEVLEILDSLSLSDIPEEVRDIVKRPAWESLLV